MGLYRYTVQKRINLRGVGGVVVDGVGVFPFVVEASKHTAVNK